ncbi:MAG: hypothetical protein K2Y21_01415 [Phycisphaerales bacterium]|nr:hypothetical protein [Phycisphaerales bacterium]
MTSPSHNTPHRDRPDRDRPDRDAPDREVLISRVVDGVAGPSDWVEIDMISAADQNVWREIAQAQRDKQLLDFAVGRATATADRIDLPEPAPLVIIRRARIGMAQWTGWAAAAVMAVAMLVVPNWNNNTNTAGVPSILPTFDQPPTTPDQALENYLSTGKQTGRVVRQLPDFVVLDSAPAADGSGYDIIYLRQIVERARVDSLHRYKVDDSGNKTPVPVNRIDTLPPV